MPTSAQAPAVPRLTYLRIKNYRALRDVEFRDLTPLTVFIGPNGSGKSTVLDALDFLAEAVRGNLVGAWEKRNRFAGMRTRGSADDKPIEFEVEIVSSSLTFNYELVVHEIDDSVAAYSVSDSMSSDVLASLLENYRHAHLTDDHLKGYSDAGPREKLSPNGDNLPNVLYYLHTKHPETLATITAQLRRWVPGLADIVPEITSDERLLLRFKDGPFEKPLPAQYMSDGTMRLAALLTLLHEPGATGLLGIEEPENELHPQLLYRLAEELGKASATRQLLVATHSPLLLDALAPEQVWVLHRGADGYTQATRTADIANVPQLVEDGSPLGYLWTSNFFGVGNPLAPHSEASDAR